MLENIKNKPIKKPLKHFVFFHQQTSIHPQPGGTAFKLGRVVGKSVICPEGITAARAR
jgi:hypothetical protein